MSLHRLRHPGLVVIAAAALSACDLGGTPVNTADGAGQPGFRAQGVRLAATGCQADPPPDCKPISPGSSATDLVISDCRTVAPGTYTYGNVNVVNKGVLYFQDEKAPGGTNLYARSILVQQGGSVRAGAWCKPFGTGGGKLTIGLWGGPPETDSAAAIDCKDASGKAAACYPADRVGKLCTGKDSTDPCQEPNPTGASDSKMFEGYDSVSGYSLKFHGGTTFGNKVFAVGYGGSLELFGKKGVADALRTDPNAAGVHPRVCDVPPVLEPLKPGATAPQGTNPQFDPDAWAQKTGLSWARLNADAAKGATSLTLDRTVDWEAEDQIVLATTDWHPSHSELLTLSGRKDNTVLVSATQAAHEGNLYKIEPSKLSSDPKHKNTVVDVRAAVGLLTRSITIQSMGSTLQNGKPVPFPAAKDCGLDGAGNLPKEDCYYGGHFLARQGFGRVQIQGVEFHQLGQGGRMGRYPVHFHLAKDTSYTNAFVTDSSMWESNTRFVTIHATHGLNIARNVGFLSVGHAFYLEDGSEIGNSLCYNLGVSERAPFKEYFNAQDPNSPTHRAIPPILSSVDPRVGNPQVGIDASTPAMFWIMNADNDFTGNKAVGVHGVGVCYWPLNSSVSGPSQHLSWSDGYARWNNGTGLLPTPQYAGGNTVAPLRRFRGNSCGTAAYAIMTERDTGFPNLGQLHDLAGLTAVQSPHAHNDDLPMLSGNFPATKRIQGPGQTWAACQPGTNGKAYQQNADSCAVTMIDHFTTSFNWAQVNVGSIWLRPFHFVVSNSAITDQLYGGLAFISGGSPEQALTGQLALSLNSVFVASTGDTNPDASSLGPKISGLPLSPLSSSPPLLPLTKCTVGNYCTLFHDGVPYFVGDYNPKRLMTIYDGPFFSDGSILVADEKPGNPPTSSVYLYTNQPLENGQMRVVDAGVGWKQPNGFYYPPVFGFKNTGFGAGTTRHNVADQYKSYWLANGLTPPPNATSPKLFTNPNFTPIDTTTILNDLDGTLNGVKPQTGPARSSGLSNNHFYDTPFSVDECSSFGTSTMPYEFVSTFIARLLPDKSATDKFWMVGSPSPLGKPSVAVYRQYRLPDAPDGTESCDKNPNICADANTQSCRRGTFFMGASIGQAMGLTVRDGLFFVDTATAGQPSQGSCLGATRASYQLATFEGGKSYAIYHLFANSKTRVTYQIHVGKSFNGASGFQWLRVTPRATGNESYQTSPATDSKLPAPGTTPGSPVWFDAKTGVLTVTIDQSWIADSYKLHGDQALACEPSDLCKFDKTTNSCIPTRAAPPGYEGMEDDIARICKEWVTPAYAEVESGADQGLYLGDCPAGGCLGFAFTLPGDFSPKAYKDVGQKLSKCYPKNEIWNRPMTASDSQSCPVPQARFCTN